VIQHGVCGVDDQSGGEPAVRQETTDAVDTEGRTPAVAVPNKGVKQRTGGRFPALVSAVSRSGKGRYLTPDLEADSTTRPGWSDGPTWPSTVRYLYLLFLQSFRREDGRVTMHMIITTTLAIASIIPLGWLIVMRQARAKRRDDQLAKCLLSALKADRI
jgi:hypothetical protein